MQPLFNPVWYALNGRDRKFNQGNEKTGFFPAEVSPFVGMPDWSQSQQHLLYTALPPGRSWSVMIAEEVSFSADWETRFSTTLHQMVCGKLIPAHYIDTACQPLSEKNIPAMLALTALTKPGPFYSRTIEFGNFKGIFDGEELVAMAGERLHIEGYTEVSAVCTHPDYEGRGYGAILVSEICRKIIDRGEKPFLHVKWDNQRAIKMYERLGFSHHTDMFFAVFAAR